MNRFCISTTFTVFLLLISVSGWAEDEDPVVDRCDLIAEIKVLRPYTGPAGGDIIGYRYRKQLDLVQHPNDAAKTGEVIMVHVVAINKAKINIRADTLTNIRITAQQFTPNANTCTTAKVALYKVNGTSAGTVPPRASFKATSNCTPCPGPVNGTETDRAVLHGVHN